jgi:threonine dehydratase
MRALRPEIRLVGVHIDRGAHTIADGIAVKYPGEMTMRILEELLDELVVVGDEEISESIALLLERSKLVVEGAGAVGVAALLTGKVGGTGSVCALLSGGNIDPTLLIPVMRHGLSLAGRILVIRSRLTDRPGELIKLLRTVAEQRANIVAIEHRREGVALQVADVGIELTLITRNEEHCLSLIAGVEAAGFPVDRQR